MGVISLVMRSDRRLFAAVVLICVPFLTAVQAQEARIDIFVGDDAIGNGYRDASWGDASGADYIRLVNGSKMPVVDDQARVGRTSGLIEYRHAGGSWALHIAAEDWPEFDLSGMDSLVLYLNGPETVPAGELPWIGLEDGAKVHSSVVPLADYVGDGEGDVGTWQRVALPLEALDSATFDITRTQTVRFVSGSTRTELRRLWVDHIHATGIIEGAQRPPAPAALETRDGDRSVIVRWEAPEADVHGYRVYRAVGESMEEVEPLTTRTDFVDTDVENGVVYRYAVRTVDEQGIASEPSADVTAMPRPLSDDEFLELLQRTAFDYFWNEADPLTGQVRDRDTPGSACSIAATGMGLSVVTIGIDQGWISREDGRSRILTTLRSMQETPQGPEQTGTSGYRGFYYHFLDCSTATRAGTNELSTIDTALLMAGVLHAGEYFDGMDHAEVEIRELAAALYERVEWDWAQVRPPLIGHGWTPESGHIRWDYGGYNETMVLYLLALGSPTHPVDATAWTSFTRTYSWETHYGLSFVTFPPLFGHQYSHLWFDFRGIADSRMRGFGIDYFENSRRSTLANRAYAVDNPQGYPNYGPDEWGLTASDIPGGYLARGAPPAQDDDGTIAPTAPGGSIAFTPDESLAALRAMYDRYRTRLWGPYGFRDAYNVAQEWFAPGHIGIDQGPFALMIENLQTGRIWEVFMRNEAAQRGLERAGFQTFHVNVDQVDAHRLALTVNPNPILSDGRIEAELDEPRHVVISVFDVLGRQVAQVADQTLPSGLHRYPLDASRFPAGVYFVRMSAGGESLVSSIVVR